MRRQLLLIVCTLLLTTSIGMSTDKKPEKESAAVVKQEISIVNKEILITWHANIESDLKFYLIERKEGESFEVFGLSMRNDQHDQYATKEYQFFDQEPKSGTNIYRLVEVDFDDNKRYHEEMTINFSENFESQVIMSSATGQKKAKQNR